MWLSLPFPPRVSRGRVWAARGDTVLCTFSAPREPPSLSWLAPCLCQMTPTIHVDATPHCRPQGLASCVAGCYKQREQALGAGGEWLGDRGGWAASPP